MTERVCKGPCLKTLPETEEYFYFRKSSNNGKLYASSYCRVCEKSKSSTTRKNKYSTSDGKALIDVQNKQWRDNHPEAAQAKLVKQNKRYAEDETFREQRKASTKVWRAQFPWKKKAANAAWHQRTKKRTFRKISLFATFYPDLKLRGVLRRGICEALRMSGGSKAGRSILKFLPYTMGELRNHLENHTEKESWMDWSNYGAHSFHRRTWQIDHIIPQAKLSFSDFSDPNFLKCWSLENLRPLESSKNLEKGCR